MKQLIGTCPRQPAPLILLDEATANIDSLNEAAIQAATERLLAERTVIVIAHGCPPSSMPIPLLH